MASASRADRLFSRSALEDFTFCSSRDLSNARAFSIFKFNPDWLIEAIAWPAVRSCRGTVTREPTEKWHLEDLADVACTSTRNLSRLFAQYAGCSPLDYVQLIRFALAKELVVQTRLDLEEVAKRAGFHSAQHLRRVWLRWETKPPNAFRSAMGGGRGALQTTTARRERGER